VHRYARNNNCVHIVTQAQIIIAAKRHRTLVVALLLSLAVHATLYFGTPDWVASFTPAKPAQYDATLAALAPSPPVAMPSAAAKKPARTRAKPVIRRPDISQRAVADSDAALSSDASAAIDSAIAAGLASATADIPVDIPVDIPTNVLAAASASAEVATETTNPKAKSSASLPAFAERIAIDYKLTSSITDGVARFRWTRQGDRYEIESTTEATGFLVAAFAGVIHQKSTGSITSEGLRPSQFSIRRGEAESESAEFLHDTKALTLKRRRDTRTVPLPREMQDMQSFLFQLAYDAPRLVEDGDRLDVVVTNARKVYRHQFRNMGREVVETRFGKIDTLRLLSEATNPEDSYEVWLAPQYLYLPVKIRLYLGKFPVEQIATRIAVSAQ
jgi:Protein of unknown function (DUF3108)